MSGLAYCPEDKLMFEIGDSVRERGSQQIRTIAGIGPGEFFRTEIGLDSATVKMFKAADLELVAKAAKPGTGPSIVPKKSITDVGY
jgi:hypothetical protein